MISVIVPVFNAEKYLTKCIESILSQSYRDWELLLIDDGSIDSSGEICRDYQEKDDRIIYHYTENNGVSHARNLGIEFSKGECIMFVDADDELRPHALSYCHNSMLSSNADIICAECQSVYANGKEYSYKRPSFECHILSNEDYLKKILTYDTLCSIWAKLYRKSTIGDCRFIQNARRGQDLLFWSSLLKSKECTVLLTSEVIYNYRILDNSVSHNVSKQVPLIKQLIKNIISQKDSLLDKQQHLKVYYDFAIFYCCNEILNIQGVKKEIDSELYDHLISILPRVLNSFDVDIFWREILNTRNPKQASRLITKHYFLKNCLSEFKKKLKTLRCVQNISV